MTVLKQHFPNAKYWPAATAETISAAETALGILLPDQLREFYLKCDGFREDKGNAKYLLSLLDDDFIGSVVRTTKCLWAEVSAPNLKPFVFFGSSSGDECWGINVQQPTEIIAYHHHMGNQYEVVGSNILDVWKADYALYDKVF